MPRLSLSALAIAAAVFAGGAGLTAAVVGVLEGEEARRRELVQQSEAGQLLERVAERFRDVSVRWRELDELAGLIDLSQPGVFDAFAAPIVANSEPIQVLEWVTEVRSGERALIEAQLSARAGQLLRLREIGPDGAVWSVVRIPVHRHRHRFWSPPVRYVALYVRRSTDIIEQ